MVHANRNRKYHVLLLQGPFRDGKISAWLADEYADDTHFYKGADGNDSVFLSLVPWRRRPHELPDTRKNPSRKRIEEAGQRRAISKEKRAGSRPWDITHVHAFPVIVQ
ncbi:MAG: hypothetical protein ACOX62_11035 [Christensenellales bacterium]